MTYIDKAAALTIAANILKAAEEGRAKVAEIEASRTADPVADSLDRLTAEVRALRELLAARLWVMPTYVPPPVKAPSGDWNFPPPIITTVDGT